MNESDFNPPKDVAPLSLEYETFSRRTRTVSRYPDGDGMIFQSPPPTLVRVTFRLAAVAVLEFLFGSLTWNLIDPGRLVHGDELLRIALGSAICLALLIIAVQVVRQACTPMILRVSADGLMFLAPRLIFAGNTIIRAPRLRRMFVRPLGGGIGKGVLEIQCAWRWPIRLWAGHNVHELELLRDEIFQQLGFPSRIHLG